eukprot:7352464-Pyramimonas_sp.AAC.1
MCASHAHLLCAAPALAAADNCCSSLVGVLGLSNFLERPASSNRTTFGCQPSATWRLTSSSAAP